MTMPTPVRVFETPEALGEDVAADILARIARASAGGRRFLLGCPTGRTPRPIFAAMAARLAAAPADLSHLTLVMMDEYLVPIRGALRYAPSEQPWSCHHFARVEIAQRLNASLQPAWRIGDEQVWFPDPDDPEQYDARITSEGGLDYFLLASGARDGHVAFNPPGSPRSSRSRVIELSDETRRDNLQTFPSFERIENVPRHGVSVGIETIVASRAATMVVLGSGKGLSLAQMLRANRYEPDWPATLIHECARGEILCDRAARAAADSA
jgi:glucosamine-6-phosphate deaminase